MPAGSERIAGDVVTRTVVDMYPAAVTTGRGRVTADGVVVGGVDVNAVRAVKDRVAGHRIARG